MIRVVIAAAVLCASPVETLAAQRTEPAPATAAASLVPEPPAGKGQVVFFRRSSIMGMPYWTNVRENGAAYGKLGNGTYFMRVFEPGVHAFDTSVLGKDTMKVQVDPGETYYVEGKITMALVGYTIVMTPSDAGVFQRVLKGMKPAKAEATVAPAPAP